MCAYEARKEPMYMMETEDGPKAIEIQEYEFEKRFPGQI
jgi:hypothetical protein